MSCDSSCSQTAAPTSVWLGSCFPGREEDLTVAANPQEREIPAQQAEWFRRVSSPTSVCTGGSDASNHGDLKKDWGKAVPTKGEEKTPERPALNNLEPSKNGKGHKVAIKGYKGSSILSMGHFQNHGWPWPQSQEVRRGQLGELTELVFMERQKPINLCIEQQRK